MQIFIEHLFNVENCCVDSDGSNILIRAAQSLKYERETSSKKQQRKLILFPIRLNILFI